MRATPEHPTDLPAAVEGARPLHRINHLRHAMLALLLTSIQPAPPVASPAPSRVQPAGVPRRAERMSYPDLFAPQVIHANVPYATCIHTVVENGEPEAIVRIHEHEGVTIVVYDLESQQWHSYRVTMAQIHTKAGTVTLSHPAMLPSITSSANGLTFSAMCLGQPVTGTVSRKEFVTVAQTLLKQKHVTIPVVGRMASLLGTFPCSGSITLQEE